ncbi:hypothetical protein BJY24_000071 [Nocardia transvalensis]|uniref:Uncharacterized protein n=1 Tax=Nocardia transvalensis TaxID=37333 RepID=A0A7W9P8P7_9NOCA|nr:hypothetical protein [Nocardia transvalensis]MBB5911204.1 hypothetical protein [Nocardia transvalensis]
MEQPHSGPAAGSVLPQTWYCVHCGGTPAAPVTIRGHRGRLLWMTFLHRTGPFCRNCGLAVYRRMTLENVWLGWWGPFSMFINAATMLFNVLTYREIARLAPPIPGMPGQPLDPGKPLFRRPAAIGFVIPAAVASLAIALIATNATSSSATSTSSSSATSAETLAIDLTGLCRTLSTEIPEPERLGPITYADKRSAQTCTWDSDTRYVLVEVQATDDAASDYRARTKWMASSGSGGARLEDVPGLGDRASAAQSKHYADTGAAVVVQAGHLTTQVTWTGQGVSYADAEQQAIVVARRALELAKK